MKTKELIKLLESMPQDAEIVVFAGGDEYPVLSVAIVENAVELGCGWIVIQYN